jgi:probable phosphoglycerate mutase
MSRLILVRHGSTAWTGRRYCGRADPPLSAVGRREADEAAAAIGPLVAAGTPVRTSPLTRARGTADAIAAATGGPLVIDEHLVEVDVGAAEGLTYGEVQRRWPALADALRGGSIAIDWPGGERPADVRRRIAAAIEAWDRSADLVVVGHGFALAVAISLLGTGAELDRAKSIGAFRPGGFVVLEGVGVAESADGATGADLRMAAGR